MAYVIKPRPKGPKPARLPMVNKLVNGDQIEIDRFGDNKESYDKDFEWMRGLLNAEIEEGISYPQDTTLSVDDFKAYFLSADAFTVRNRKTQELMGGFYLKPNFPGRCNHICNGGFLVSPPYRKLGLGKIMGKAFCFLAKDLGYRASMFNLVFVNNIPSIKLWRSLGFVETGLVPKAGRMKNGEEVDAIQFYRDFRGDIIFPDEQQSNTITITATDTTTATTAANTSTSTTTSTPSTAINGGTHSSVSDSTSPSGPRKRKASNGEVTN